MIVTVVLLLLAVANVHAGLIHSLFSTTITGYGTYYGPSVKTNGGGNCGYGIMYPDFVFRSSPAVTLIAMNPTYYKGDSGTSDGCGLCVSIKGTGTGSGANPISTTPWIGFVQDQLPSGGSGDIDLALTGDGKWGISWTAVACPVTSGDYFFYKFQGSNNYYIKLQVVNAKLPIASVKLTISGTDYSLTRTSDNFWVLSPIPATLTFPLTVKVTSTGGETVTDSIPIAQNDISLNCDVRIQGKKQFTTSTGILQDSAAGQVVSSQSAIYIGAAVGCAILVAIVVVAVIVIKRRAPHTEIV